MRHYVRRALALMFLFLLLGPMPARAKTVEEWLEGFDTGETWFGEDFAYDITDEAACWELLMKPITILDAGQREEIYPRQTPDGKKVNNDKLGGFINGASAAVHVLGEDEDGWTLIEGIDYYNRVIRGYVRTRLLKTVTPNEKYGVIIDKLTQRLYVFIDGKLWDSCLVSTGLPNDEQPYNETAAGEYLLCSWVGDFDSEGMICATALRFNGGDMIHEVPHNVGYDGSRSYGRWEALLGQRASHGCVRTQRIATEKGLNARWLWDNLKKNTKVIVWDDKGRKMPYPDDSRQLFYNPNGGQYYHADAYCSSVKTKYKPLSAFTYGELDTSAYLGLEPCAICQPPRRKTLIAKENLARGAITEAEYQAALTPIDYPSKTLSVYYNPQGGKYYHSTANCSSVKERWLPLTAFAYGDLDTTSFKALTPCPYCGPPLRVEEIDQANLALGIPQERVTALRQAYESGEGAEAADDAPSDSMKSGEATDDAPSDPTKSGEATDAADDAPSDPTKSGEATDAADDFPSDPTKSGEAADAADDFPSDPTKSGEAAAPVDPDVEEAFAEDEDVSITIR